MLLAITSLGKAQVQSVQGNFQVNEVIGCAPFTVSPQLLVSTTGTVAYAYENTSDPTPCLTDPALCQSLDYIQSTSFTYNTPGTYYLTQVIAVPGGNPEIDFIEITVIEPTEPSFEIDLCSGNEVVIEIDPNNDYDSYGINLGDGTGTFVVNKGGSNAFTYVYAIQGTYTINVSGLLSNGNTANCGTATPQTVTTIDNIPAPTIQEVIAEGQTGLSISYQNLDPNINYQLETDFGNGFEVFTDIDPQINPTNLMIDDPSIDNNNTSFSLRLAASDACSGTPVYSDEISTIAFDFALSPIIDEIPIDYSWSTSDNDFNGADFYQGGNLVFDISQATGTQTLGYNACTAITEVFIEKIENGVLVRSRRAIPYENETYTLPQMSTPTAVVDGANVILTFSDTAFPFSTIRVYRQNADGDFEQIGASSSLEYLDVGVSGSLTEACYITDYIDECGNVAAQSTEVCVPLEGLLRTPSAFTPNGDNFNDIFFVGSGVFDQFQLLIFNKWGSLVFKADDISQGWNGDFDGQEAPMGTYQYKISYNRDGRIVVTTGTVTLIR